MLVQLLEIYFLVLAVERSRSGTRFLGPPSDPSRVYPLHWKLLETTAPTFTSTFHPVAKTPLPQLVLSLHSSQNIVRNKGAAEARRPPSLLALTG